MSRTKNEILDDIRRSMLNNDELFVDMCEELDDHEGFLGDSRCYPMEDFDDHVCGRGYLEVFDDLDSSFDTSDNYFYGGDCDAFYSTYDNAAFYRDSFEVEDVIDKVLHYVEDDDDDFCFHGYRNIEALFKELAHHDEHGEYNPCTVTMRKGNEETLVGIFRNHAFAQDFVNAMGRDLPEEMGECYFLIEDDVHDMMGKALA